MKTKTNQTVPALQEWAHRENRICSAIMQEPVTNLQLLHIWHVALPAMMGMACTDLCATVALFAWSAAAYKLAKKGGRV